MKARNNFVQPLTKHAERHLRAAKMRTGVEEDEIDFQVHAELFGITLRQHYATQALQGILSSGFSGLMRDAVTDAFLAADLMLEQEN